MVGQALELLKWRQVRLVLLLDLPFLIHRLRGESTWPMEVQVRIEYLFVERLDLCCLRLWNVPVPHLLADNASILPFDECLVIAVPCSTSSELDQ